MIQISDLRNHDLAGVDFDVDLLGFDAASLDALLQDPEALGGDGLVEGEDDVPDRPTTPVSVPGDL